MCNLFSGISRRSARIAYRGLVALSLVVSSFLREVAAPLLQKIPWINYFHQNLTENGSRRRLCCGLAWLNVPGCMTAPSEVARGAMHLKHVEPALFVSSAVFSVGSVSMTVYMLKISVWSTFVPTVGTSYLHTMGVSATVMSFRHMVNQAVAFSPMASVTVYGLTHTSSAKFSKMFYLAS